MASCLIVEDHGDTREGYTEFLSGCGFAVRAAAGADEFWQLVRDEAPDIILMDLQLPDTDGWDLTRQLRTDWRTAAVPVVVVSACVRDSDRERALASGADAFLPKPCDLDEILETLTRLVTARRR